MAVGLRRAAWLLAVMGPQSVSAQSTPPASPFPSDSAVLALIRQRVEEGRSAGIVIGLLEPDGKRRIIAHGDPGPGKLPLDGSSVFEIGSITKVFTGILLAQMVLAGEVRLDDPVQKFLPPGVTVPQRNGKQITLSHLAQHKSGLPRLPTNLRPRDAADPYVDYTAQRMYEFLSGHTLTRDPGSTKEYSNVGFFLLGQTLSLAGGKPYEELQRERIWTPLGLSQTSIMLTPWQREHLVVGHSPSGDVVSNWDLTALPGAGAIRSTANDMLTFLAANLNTDRGPLGAALAFAHENHPVPGSTETDRLAWATGVTPRDTILWHNGGTGGYRTFIGMSRARKVGVVVLTNSGGEGADDIGVHLLDPARPLAPAPSFWERTSILERTTLLGVGVLVASSFYVRRRRVRRARLDESTP